MTDPLQTPNPYATPQAQLVTETVQDEAGFRALGRFHTIWVVLLTLGSLGLYPPVWMLLKTQRFNAIYPKDSVNMPFTLFICVLVLVAGMFDIVDLLGGYYRTLSYDMFIAFKILQYTANIAMLIWAFYFRAKLRNFIQYELDDIRPVGVLWTFLFGIFFLQFKINQVIDDLDDSNRE
jgi:hypothetical protein